MNKIKLTIALAISSMLFAGAVQARTITGTTSFTGNEGIRWQHTFSIEGKTIENIKVTGSTKRIRDVQWEAYKETADNINRETGTIV